jgi:hypothetical protein
MNNQLQKHTILLQLAHLSTAQASGLTGLTFYLLLYE